MQSASVDLEHDLTNRLRSLSRLIDERVDGDDPGDGLVFEAWVHKRTIEEVVAHYRLIADRANALADEIGQQFATLDPHAVFEVDVSMPDDLLATVHVNRQQRLLKDGVARRIVPTGQGYRSGLFVTSVVGAVNALPWIPLLGLPFAGSMARRALSDDRVRRRTELGQELARLATRYLDEIGSIVHDDSRHTIPRIERDIGEHYAARAEQVELTLQHAMVSATQARSDLHPTPASTDTDDRATIREVVSVAQRLLAGAAIAS